MEYEIELKLLTNEQAGEMIETKLLPQLKAKAIQQTLVLTNHYFDSSDRTLRRHDIGLRIRGNNQKFEQTLKTAGKSIGGLHQRPEYNVQLDESKKHNVEMPDLSLFPVSAWPETIDVAQLQTKIEILFTTYFKRKIYLLEFPQGDIIELVWDLGEVRSGNKSLPICEIELELKKGSTAALFNLAKRIVSVLPCSIGKDSKAARGYSLLDDFLVKESVAYQLELPQSVEADVEVFAGLLTALLGSFQMLSVEINRQYSEKLVANIKQVVIGLVDIASRFSLHFPCPPIDNIHMRLKALVSDWTVVAQQKDENAARSLLTLAATTQLQLDIVQCLVEKPWCAEAK